MEPALLCKCFRCTESIEHVYVHRTSDDHRGFEKVNPPYPGPRTCSRWTASETVSPTEVPSGSEWEAVQAVLGPARAHRLQARRRSRKPNLL